jgi:hypothetical protein
MKDHQEAMRRQLDALMAAAGRVGAKMSSVSADAVPDVPAGLIAATHSPRPGGEPVMLTAGDRDVIAVIGSRGDPARVWAEIRQRGRLT